ncbi:DUF1653 domain-containing protein [archaeon]|jgi:hypothetical protein|nr:DUF1653 domain-containing protein [archaeon]
MREIKVGQKYRHFKDKNYEIIALARDCEDANQKIVVYKALYDSEFGFGQIWTRTLEDFLGIKEINGQKIQRFKLIEN